MPSPFVPPRHVLIGDAAAFVGTTPRAIRHYHDIGLLPEPPRGADDRRRYGYDDMVRLLWIRTMADAGLALDDIRDAFDGAAPAGDVARADADRDVEDVLERLEASLAAKEAELQRQRAAVRSMRARGSRTGLLSDLVADRLAPLPAGALRESDLDDLLVTERMLGPLGAAFRASRFIALATHPDLREEADRVEAAEAELDDTVAVDDPRVAEVAAARHAVERELDAVVERSGLAADEEALFAAWDAQHPVSATEGSTCTRGEGSMTLLDASRLLPYDLSPARLRCLELAEELAVRDLPAP